MSSPFAERIAIKLATMARTSVLTETIISDLIDADINKMIARWGGEHTNPKAAFIRWLVEQEGSNK